MFGARSAGRWRTEVRARTAGRKGRRPMTSDKIILRTEGLTKHYGGVHALEDADFELRDGEHVAVVGDNGAGKSTFVRQITGVEVRTRGTIWFDGQEVAFDGPLDARHAGIETVFPEPGAGRRPRRALQPVPGAREDPLQPRTVLDPRPQVDARGHRGGAQEDRGEDPQPRQLDPAHVGRAAPMRGHRPLGDLRLQAHHHGRAHGGARRAGDGAGRGDSSAASSNAACR